MVSELTGREGKPAFIKFFTLAKELTARSEKEGRFIAIDVDMVEVRQLGATDSVKFEVRQWLAQNNQDVKAGRLSAEHADYHQRAYDRWKAGQEMPVEGTPIKGWAVISPAQTEILLHVGIRTVEDLSAVNAEVVARIGMGGVMLKRKAQTWLAQAQDRGPLTMQMTALQQENELLKLNLETLTRQVDALAQTPAPRAETLPVAIAVGDLLDDDGQLGGAPQAEPPKRSHKKKET
jgi:hypothetical protein